MPRTKRPARKSAQSVEQNEVLKKLHKTAEEQKKKLDARAQMECRNIELAFKILQGSINDVYLKKTVGELRSELYLKEVTNTGRSTARYSQAPSQDDGYNTENSSHGTETGAKSVKGKKFATPASRPPTASSGRSTSRRSRSADAAATGRRAAPPRTVQSQRRRSRSVYRTPAYNNTSALNYPAITPKVAPHTPLTVLRQPRQGEMVVSMSGSPVMVPTCYTMNPDEKANCNILLQDGTMLSLQPKQLRQSQAYIPFSLMDTNVLHQLKTLKNNLETVVKLGERAMM